MPDYHNGDNNGESNDKAIIVAISKTNKQNKV